MEKEIRWLLKEKYQNKPGKNFEKDVSRLKRGEPLDYVIGFTEFLGCKIDLSKRPLIPRQETEFWVEKAVAEIKNMKPFGFAQGKILRILDIFSGSGCIGVAVLKHCPGLLCDFADIDEKNLKQIKINLKMNKIKLNRYKIIRSDVFNGLNPSSSRLLRTKYDFVFANPPYIADYKRSPSARLRATLRNRIQKSVLEFEPNHALFGGVDGLFYIRKFLKEAKNYLRPAGGGCPNGKIYMEFDYIQKREIEKLLKKFGYKKHQFFKDQHKRWRWVEIN